MVRCGKIVGLKCCVALFWMACASAHAQSLSHFPDALFHDNLEDVAGGPYTDADAARFLAQGTFGTTAADITHLRAVRYRQWFTEQFAATPSLERTSSVTRRISRSSVSGAPSGSGKPAATVCAPSFASQR